MTEETTLDLAIVRNRLLAGKADHRDRELLMAAQIAAGKREAGSPYIAVFQWAIANALSDIESGRLTVPRERFIWSITFDSPPSGRPATVRKP
jgi:hypothetical protein